jgi:hypothetical protein
MPIYNGHDIHVKIDIGAATLSSQAGTSYHALHTNVIGLAVDINGIWPITCFTSLHHT